MTIIKGVYHSKICGTRLNYCVVEGSSATRDNASRHNSQRYREANMASSSRVVRPRERRSASPDRYAIRLGYGYPTGFLDRIIREHNKARSVSSSPAAHNPSSNSTRASVSQPQTHQPNSQILDDDEEEMRTWIEAMIFQNDNDNQIKQRPLGGSSVNTISSRQETPEGSTRNKKDKGKGRDPDLYPRSR